jgi:hypothetical protein
MKNEQIYEGNSQIRTPRDALVLALILSITAPNEEKRWEASDMAEHFASGMSEFEVAAAKRDALAQVNLTLSPECALS